MLLYAVSRYNSASNQKRRWNLWWKGYAWAFQDAVDIITQIKWSIHDNMNVASIAIDATNINHEKKNTSQQQCIKYYTYTTQFIFINTLSILLFKSLCMHFLFRLQLSTTSSHHRVNRSRVWVLFVFFGLLCFVVIALWMWNIWQHKKNIWCAFVFCSTLDSPPPPLLHTSLCSVLCAPLEHAKWMVCSCV